MRILITGSRGFIGNRLFTKVIQMVNRAKPLEVFEIDIKYGYNLITCDLPKNIDIIYHLAAQSSVEASWHDPVHDMDNIRMTARLLKEYPEAKIIYTASAATPTTSPYGFSKWAAGEMIKNFHKKYVICTLPNVYGERGGKSVVDIFKEQDEVTIYGDGKQTRSYVHVDDIVEALILAENWDNGYYFLGDGKATSVLELAKGKKIKFAPAREEAKEAVMWNSTDVWKPKINVIKYLNEKI